MHTAASSHISRKPTNVTLPESLIQEAKCLKINVSQAAEAGLLLAVTKKREEQWLAQNQAALDSSNAFVESRGLPLAKHRSF